MAYASFSKVAVVSAALSLFTPAAAHLFQCPNHETVWITPEGTQYGICDNTDYKNGGGSLAVHNCVPSTQECLKFCIKDSRRKKAVYDKKSQMCHLKNNDKTAEMDWADDNGFDVIHRDQGSELDDGTSIKTCPNTGAGYSSGKTFFTVCVNTDYTGPNAHTFRNAPSPHACADTCAKTKDCKKAVYDVKNKICYVKEAGSNVKLNWVKDERFISIDTKTGAADDNNKDSDDPVDTKPETPKGAAAKVGQWSDVIKLPLIPVAAYIVPAYPEPAKMLFFSSWGKAAFGGASGKTQFGDYEFVTGAVWDREVANTHHDMFCPGISQLEDGRVMVQGGSDAEAVSIYDPATNEFTRGPDMKVARGYQTSAIMSNGHVFTIGGAYAGSREAKNGEVFNPDNQEWTYLPGADVKPMMTIDHEGVWREDNHAWLFGWKNESIFQAGPSLDQHWYSTEGEGSVVKAGTRDDDDAMCGVWAMYDAVAGKILSAGGAPEYTDSDATARAHITTVGEAFAPSVVERVPDMASPRGFANAVVLPDGTVLVTGGQRRAVVFTNTDAVLTAEIFNPTTKTWTQLAAAAVPRNYHSVSILLPDATVFTGGGGLCYVSTIGGSTAGCNKAADHADGEIFSPPYLFNDDGSAAPRPAISGLAQEAVSAGATLSFDVEGNVASFSLIRTGTVTHSVNSDQRRIPLKRFRAQNGKYTVTLPTDRGVLLPGYYYLFAISAKDVPSVAKSVHVVL
ncbi:Galactose oxidase like protein [Verticillium longisporum]|uniref:Galactose oxidase like protein n=1 Tax=Verticillium longisporum TaxID=100787 RepID=A0A8I3AWT5_VERLO|nr:Galactose oxidase like protein [Verticillium longisporum]